MDRRVFASVCRSDGLDLLGRDRIDPNGIEGFGTCVLQENRMSYQRFAFDGQQASEALAQFGQLLGELEQQEVTRMVLRRDPSFGDSRNLSRVSMGPLLHQLVTGFLMRSRDFRPLEQLIPSGLFSDATLQLRLERRRGKRLLRLIRAIPVSGH
jgi:hypothetical protein